MGLAERFFARFDGLRRAHGTYAVGAGNDARGKVGGRARTVQKPVTVESWRDHLEGRVGLGVVPIRDDATCVFGAIDVDVYPLDLKVLYDRVTELKFPLVVTRTKSGGAHLYLFLSSPVPASEVREKLSSFAAALNYAKSEVFPKQDRLESDEDTGNWINMPYFDGDRSTRYGVKPNGAGATAEEYADMADAAAVTPDVLRSIEATVPKSKANLPGAPPCLVTLSASKVVEGGRNNGLFNYGVFARKAFPDRWKTALEFYNRELVEPPLPQDEFDVVVKSLGKKRYSYRCKEHPIVGVCDRKTCLTREHGVGGGVAPAEAGIEFGDLTRVLTKPVTWLWLIDGEVIEFETAQIMQQALFQHRIFEILSFWPPAMKPTAWRNLVQSRLDVASEIVVPEDATLDGQVWEHLARFSTSRVVGRSLDELLMEKPFTDAEKGRTFFVATDFLKYLSAHRFPTRMNERLLYVSLRPRGLEHHRTMLKGVMVSYWSVPAFVKQTEEHAPPRSPEGAM